MNKATPLDLPDYGPWELAVLCLLREEPRHPYEIQRLLRARHKTELLALKPGSLYYAIKRLVRARLIEAVRTGREGKRPERTTYRIAPEGLVALRQWLRDMIAVPRRESSDFMTAVSFLIHLDPEEAAGQLEQRTATLERTLAQIDVSMAMVLPLVTRVNLLEEEYLRAMCHAELLWVRRIVAELREGRLTWDLDTLLALVRAARTKKAPVTP
jgi:DNA-binding PadR family transcriptional regulator